MKDRIGLLLRTSIIINLQSGSPIRILLPPYLLVTKPLPKLFFLILNIQSKYGAKHLFPIYVEHSNEH